MTGRELLEALGPILEPARAIRYEADSLFDDVSDADLELAARGLRAISYSCFTGAAKLERIVHLRGKKSQGTPPARDIEQAERPVTTGGDR